MWYVDWYVLLFSVPWYVSDGCPGNPGKLRCPDPDSVSAFDAAVTRGDIVFTASPFNVSPEMVFEPSFFKDLVGISASLEARYNITNHRKVWSNVDGISHFFTARFFVPCVMCVCSRAVHILL